VLFILRDFCEEEDNGENIKKTLFREIDCIWEQISKPHRVKDKALKDFFEFEILLMPHKIYAKR